MTWTKYPQIEGSAPLPPSSVLAVGFGACNVTRDGIPVYDEQDHEMLEDWWTCEQAEAIAAQDPDHDWQIFFMAPLYEALYQRQGFGNWVLVKKGKGFA